MLAPLDVVVPYSNPIRFRNRRLVHENFEDALLGNPGVRLTTIECAYGDRGFELEERKDVRRVRVRSSTLVWNKENLINIGISRLPEGWKYVATIDGDVIFKNRNWADETVHKLQLDFVIQPWQHCYDLGPNGQHLDVHESLLSLWWRGKPIVQGIGNPATSGYQFGHPGYAWAWKREALERVGCLLETAALGAADHHMGLGLFGLAPYSYPPYISDQYKRDVLNWQARACQHINQRVGHVEGTIEHLWHGRKTDRRYIDRWEIVRRHGFNPDSDLKRNTHGVLELAGNKPAFGQDIMRYFHQRNDDANTVS